jgi:ferredoxin
LAAKGAITLVRVLSHADGAIEGRDYDAIGRIDETLLTKTLPLEDYDFYLCGPPAFTQSIYDGLRRLDVRDERMHAEAFGPGSLNRASEKSSAAEPLLPAATVAVPIVFVASGKLARWTPEAGSLLDLAETRGLSPEFSCRKGDCGTCRIRILKGPLLIRNRHPTRCATARLSFASQSLLRRTPARSSLSISTSDFLPPQSWRIDMTVRDRKTQGTPVAGPAEPVHG